MCKHKWNPLYTKPTTDAPLEARADYLLLRNRAEQVVCTECGRVGVPSRGYRRGCGTGQILVSSEAVSAEMRAAAQAWNRRLGVSDRYLSKPNDESGIRYESGANPLATGDRRGEDDYESQDFCEREE